MKKEFLEFLDKLMENDKELTESLMNENVRSFIDYLRSEDSKESKVILTDNGKEILKFLQSKVDEKTLWKSREIAEGMFITSRKVSGTLRKMVNDGFCEKVGQDPIVYTLTEKGKNFNIE